MRRLESAGFAVVRAAVLVSVGVVPLLVDPRNGTDPFYAVKAWTIQALAAFIVIGFVMLGPRGLRGAHVPWRPLSAFAAAAVVATLAGLDPSWSLWGAPWRHEGLLTLIAYAVVCAGTALVVSRGGGRPWAATVLVGAGVAALLGIAQVMGWDGLPRDLTRAQWTSAYATSGNPNWLGGYMLLATPLAAAASVGTIGRHLRPAGTLLLPVLTLAGIETFSRTTWLLLIVSVPISLVWVAGLTTRRAAVVATPVILAVVALVTLSPARPAVLPRVTDLLDPRAGPVQERHFLWSRTLVLLSRRPVTGFGPEGFPLAFNQAWSAEKRDLFGDEPLVMDKAHNETLDMAMSVGIMGLVAFFWLMYASLRRAWAQSALGAACLISAAAYLLHLQAHFSVVSVAPLFWSVLGAAYGLGGRGPGAGVAGDGPGGAGASTVNAAAKPPWTKTASPVTRL